MKKLFQDLVFTAFILFFLFTVIMCQPKSARADGVYAFAGVFAFDVNDTQSIPTPDGYFGIMYSHDVTDKFRLNVGFKHESTIPEHPNDISLNGFFTEFELKLY